METIKLIVSDLDGTLFDSDLPDYQISEELIRKVAELRAHGIGFTIATGRPAHSSMWVAKALKLEMPFIAYNGAMIVDQHNNIIYEKTFDIEAFESFIKQADKNGSTILLYTKGGIYYYRKRKAVDVYELKEKTTCLAYEGQEETLSDVNKILLIGDNATHLELWNSNSNWLDKKYKYFLSEENYMEIVDGSVSKGKALKRLKNELAFKDHEVLGIGNQMNDKELLEEAFIGVAVNNAVEKLKLNADYVTKGNFETGVTEVIETILTTKASRRD